MSWLRERVADGSGMTKQQPHRDIYMSGLSDGIREHPNADHLRVAHVVPLERDAEPREIVFGGDFMQDVIPGSVVAIVLPGAKLRIETKPTRARGLR